ncbi:hypothetical protein [Fulvimarina sp. MAC8]|uniref:hypothetical protein n=1 Tax=Fulvimarina sp. MAC8 TaxID=3162874 RepID=UPI0032EB4C92
MTKPIVWLIASLVVFAAFVANVVAGSFAGSAPIGRTGELILIILTSVLFVVGVLRSEARDKATRQLMHPREEHR